MYMAKSSKVQKVHVNVQTFRSTFKKKLKMNVSKKWQDKMIKWNIIHIKRCNVFAEDKKENLATEPNQIEH